VLERVGLRVGFDKLGAFAEERCKAGETDDEERLDSGGVDEEERPARLTGGWLAAERPVRLLGGREPREGMGAMAAATA
jgi:hypothetical protein